jgi:hypothetical protein
MSRECIGKINVNRTKLNRENLYPSILELQESLAFVRCIRSASAFDEQKKGINKIE